MSTNQDKTIQVGQVLSDLSEARRRYEDAGREESRARNDLTTALNKLNAAQKAFDKYVEECKEGSPMDTEWGRQRRVK